MQNLDVKDTIQKTKKTKSEIKKQLEVSKSNGRNDNTDMNYKVDSCAANEEDAVIVIQEFDKIIKNKKSDITRLAYYQGIIFKKFKEKERLVSVAFKINVSKSTITFKIALSKLIGNYPKIKKSSLSLHYFKKHLKMMNDNI